jgi:AraC-like DNA-binding protein
MGTVGPETWQTARAYTEWPVHPALADSVVCAWVNPIDQPSQLVLPDACMDIFWDGANLLVAGPDTGPTEIVPDTTFVGIRFRPGAAPGFLGVSADALRDSRVSLAAFWGREADELAEQLAGAPATATALLERALLARVPAAGPVDPLVGEVFRELARRDAEAGAVQLLARRLAVDERTLRRRCVRALGYGPKTLDRILRFRRALRLGRAGLPVVAAAAAAGYADQAHLSRECRRLAGVSPSTLFIGAAAVVTANG